MKPFSSFRSLSFVLPLIPLLESKQTLFVCGMAVKWASVLPRWGRQDMYDICEPVEP